MSKIVKPIALDETLQATNVKLETVKTNIQGVAKDATLQGVAKDATLQGVAKDATLSQTNTELNSFNQFFVQYENARNEAISTLTNELIGALASVKSINGKYGIVVLDSGDILISKEQTGSKTVKEMMDEMDAAIAKTPLTFSTVKIAGTEDDYVGEVTVGTPV